VVCRFAGATADVLIRFEVSLPLGAAWGDGLDLFPCVLLLLPTKTFSCGIGGASRCAGVNVEEPIAARASGVGFREFGRE
jgi:hypothetical protein